MDYLKLDSIRYCCTHQSTPTDEICMNTDTFSINNKSFKCSKCENSIDLTTISSILKKINTELKHLSSLFDNIYTYSKVEFEHDFKEYNSSSEHFEDAVKDFSLMPPRFNFSAIQFIKRGYRFLLHDDNLKPNLYNIPASPHVTAGFNELLQTPPSYFIFDELSQINIQSFEFVTLVALLLSYNQEYDKLVSTRQMFFYPTKTH